MKRILLADKRFSFLTVIEDLPSEALGRNALQRKALALVECACGTRLKVRTADLLHGNTKSCGCARSVLSIESKSSHGKSKTATYRTWMGMRKRCQSPKDLAFQNYGGRGIKVCERWQDFSNFLADMGEKPSGMSIERINNDGDYEPSNCRWATVSEQCRNRRSNILITFDGETKCALDWSRILGMPYATILRRIRKCGMTPLDALTQPLQFSARRSRTPRAI